MKPIIALLLLPLMLWGSKVLSYNVYDRNDRVDVMLTFDTPYEGVLRQNRQGNTITVKLEEAYIEAEKTKTVNSKYLKNITIAPQGEQIDIVAVLGQDVTMQASKTSDSYGLRLRFIPTAMGDGTQATPVDEAAMGLPTKPNNEFEQSYYIVIAILVVGILVLMWLKRSIAQKTVQGAVPSSPLSKEPKAPWLFNKSKNTDEVPAASPTFTAAPSVPLSEGIGGVKIRFQKAIDAKNTVAMLDYGTMSYLVLLGNNTVLLDKFQDNIPVTQSEFESLLMSKHRELDSFFQLRSPEDEEFDAYKEKASGPY